MTVRPNQAQHLNHLARAAGLAMPMNQFPKQPIITLRPQSPLAPRGQWLRADQRTRLAFQHVQIMFEIEHLLAAFVAALVAGDAAALIAYFDMTRIKPHLDRLAGRRRRRIKIGPHPHAAQAIDARKTDFY